MIRTVPIVPRPDAPEPYLWGRNRYARVARIEAWATDGPHPCVSLNAYSKRSDDSPCHVSNLSPDDARAIAAALIEAAEAAEAPAEPTEAQLQAMQYGSGPSLDEQHAAAWRQSQELHR